MQRKVLPILVALLIAASTVQIAKAAQRHVHKAHRASVSVGQQFRGANDSMGLPAVVSPSAVAKQYWSDYGFEHAFSAPAGRN
jgi:hypothetical protein